MKSKSTPIKSGSTSEGWEEQIFLLMYKYAREKNPAIGDSIFAIVREEINSAKQKAKREVLEEIGDNFAPRQMYSYGMLKGIINFHLKELEKK